MKIDGGCHRGYITYEATLDARRAQAFCPECGTHVYAFAADDPQDISIRTGTARQRDQLIPSAQIWCRSARPWAMNLGQIQKFQEQPPPRS